MPESLNQIARETFWEPNWVIPDDVITQALTRAGLNPNDGKERERFRLLVEDGCRQSAAEEQAHEDEEEHDDEEYDDEE